MSTPAHGTNDEWDNVIQSLRHSSIDDGGEISHETASSDQDWDQALQSLTNYQTELDIQNTQQAFTRLFERLDLTPRERQGLDPTLGQLRIMLGRLEQSVVQIAVFGLVGRGKSSLLNALIGQEIFETGPLHGVTKTIAKSQWTINGVELVDTPGIDEVDGESRSHLAHQVAKQADLILFVVAGDMTTVEHEALRELRQFSKPILLVFNKVDQYPNADRHQLYQTLKDQRVKDLLSPEEIVMASAAPLVSEVVQQADGSTTIKRKRGTPDVIGLKLKILEILQQEGKALVALNTMLYADEVHDQLVQRKTEIRDRAANDLIWQIVMAKAIATALNPITVVDILSGAVVDVVMLVALSRLYGLPMTHHGAVKLLRHIAVGMGGISITELFTTLGLSSLKGALGLAAPATGGLSLAPYVSVAIAQAGVAGVATYAIGQICKQYLANGASWGKDGPKASIKTILNSLDEASILHRVKSELEERLRQSPAGSSPKS
ncbi:MAG: GTP-binding protein [Cyanobacteria bacterium P01_F01_bin.150]